MDYFEKLFQYRYRPLKDMTKEELIEELDTYRNLWTWVEEDLKWWLCHIRYHCRLVRRDYKGLEGVLGQCHFELKAIDIDVRSEDYDYFKNEVKIEQKTITIPVNQLIDWEMIHEQEVTPMEDSPLQQKAVTPIDELID